MAPDDGLAEEQGESPLHEWTSKQSLQERISIWIALMNNVLSPYYSSQYRAPPCEQPKRGLSIDNQYNAHFPQSKQP